MKERRHVILDPSTSWLSTKRLFLCIGHCCSCVSNPARLTVGLFSLSLQTFTIELKRGGGCTEEIKNEGSNDHKLTVKTIE